MLKALIVDDNQLMRNTVKEFFKRHYPSMILQEAIDGEEAIEKVESFKPDLIMMDIRLPDQSGLKLTKKIKVMDDNIKIIILSGHCYPEYKEMAARCGANGYIVKGGGSKEILEMVEFLFSNGEESLIPRY